jgi:hypothetical protein
MTLLLTDVLSTKVAVPPAGVDNTDASAVKSAIDKPMPGCGEKFTRHLTIQVQIKS